MSKLRFPKPGFECILYCCQCGGLLKPNKVGDASFDRAATRLCWVCAHLKKSVVRDMGAEIAAETGPFVCEISRIM